MRALPAGRAAAIALLVALPHQPSTLPQSPAPTLLTLPLRDDTRTRFSGPAASVSADGRFVALASFGRLVPADADDRADIYVLDRTTGAVTLESATVDGVAIGGNCARPRLSGDGRYLVFEATLGMAADDAILFDVVLRDRAAERSTRVSRSATGGAADGWSGSPSISSDGGVLAFASTATNLVEGGDDNGATADVYLFRTGAGTVARISVDNSGRQARRGGSFAPSVSADGRYVAFASNAALDSRNPQPPRERTADVPLTTQIYVRDTQENTTRRISAALDGKLPDGSSYEPAISRDGFHVAFVSRATNLAPNDRNRTSDVFLFDAKQGSIALISRSARGGTANGMSGAPAISADGLFVAFQSDASDIVCARRCPAVQEDINLLPDVFLFDRASNVFRKISAGSGTEWMEESSGPSIDATGTVVAFSSRHPIGETDVAHDFDLFVWVKR